LNVTPPSRRQIVSRRFITYLDAGGDAGVTMIRFLQEALPFEVFYPQYMVLKKKYAQYLTIS